MTFTPNAEFNFEFETEHNVPENGFIKMTLPKEMAFPQEIIDNKDVKLTVQAKVYIDADSKETVVKDV